MEDDSDTENCREEQKLSPRILKNNKKTIHSGLNDVMSLPRDCKYVVVDVEALDHNMWVSIAFTTAMYPSGNIIAMKEFFVDRSGYIIKDAEKQAFWDAHPAAFDYNTKRGIGIPVEVAESGVCRYIEDMRHANPHFYIVSDNPQFDGGIIDDILTRNNYNPLSKRSDGMYAQMLCTWSYRQSLAKTFATKAGNLFRHPVVCRLLQVDGENDYVTSRPIEQATQPKHATACLHTPLLDGFQTLSTFFKCMDLNRAIDKHLRITLGFVDFPTKTQAVRNYRLSHPTTSRSITSKVESLSTDPPPLHGQIHYHSVGDHPISAAVSRPNIFYPDKRWNNLPTETFYHPPPRFYSALSPMSPIWINSTHNVHQSTAMFPARV